MSGNGFDQNIEDSKMKASFVSRHRRLATMAAVVVCGAAAVSASAYAAPEPATTGGEAVMIRLNPEQYRLSIQDIFGKTLTVGGRFEPDFREAGLNAVGASRVSVTSSGIEQYNASADNIAGQIVSPKHRGVLIPCKPAAETDPDDACAKQFLSEVGKLLYRRPLTQEEILTQVKIAHDAASTLKNFYAGLQISLANMLVAPPFLFRHEIAEPDPENPGHFRLDGYSKATQLSYLLWNTTPDPELLSAAERGDLHTEKGLEKQVDRLLASPRLEAGVRAFFFDMLGFDAFESLSKDTTIYPKFTFKVSKQAQEQTMLTIVDELLTRHGDYRNLFTTRKTFLTPTLASLYRIPLAQEAPNGAPDIWQAYEYPEGDPRSGILTQASFVTLHSHPGRTSPTLRGKALREAILCQKVPDPPGNVNFTVVQDTSNPVYKTARARLNAHATEAMCTGCHKITDPMGLALENFDSAGSFRQTENGEVIDTAGALDGVKFSNAAELGKVVHSSPSATSCLVNRVYSYATGRPANKGEADWMKYLGTAFAEKGYQFPALLRTIATSKAFYKVADSKTETTQSSTSQLTLQTNSSQEGRK